MLTSAIVKLASVLAATAELPILQIWWAHDYIY